MARILITGFEPFGGARTNPSKLIVESIHSDALPGHELLTAVLPVEYDASVERAVELIDSLKPDAVLCLGQAEGRTTISFERVAVNLDDARLADNGGEARVDREIWPGGPTAYFTSLPVREMLEAVKGAGVPGSLSLSAGTFVCNHLFYSLRHELDERDIPVGFVHVPLVPEQITSTEFVGQPSMPLAQQVKGILAAAKAVAESLR